MKSTLRGEELDQAAVRKIKDWPLERKLTWAALAKSLGVSRQSLERKAVVSEAYWSQKERKKKSRSDVRDSLEESYRRQTEALKAKVALLEKALDLNLERFARAEHNCLRQGWDADKLWAAFPARKETSN